MYLYLKSLHLIFVITWFAGLFYMVRLFVYHTEAKDKTELEQSILIKQYQLMQRRLWYIITYPSAILATLFAVILLVMNPALLQMGWMHIKLFFVVLLWLYHLKCHQLFLQLQQNITKHSSSFYRVWNEVATLILFAVIFLVILKNSFDWIFGVLGLFGLSILLMLGIKYYKKIREK
ncbi:MAG TPA: CopD family protein [Flavobacterium sp.]|nr:CopD family protein [Flavobacterium sp.]